MAATQGSVSMSEMTSSTLLTLDLLPLPEYDMRSMRPRVCTRRVPRIHMETAMVPDKALSSQVYIWMERRGRRRSKDEHVMVRKWEGLLRMEGSVSM